MPDFNNILKNIRNQINPDSETPETSNLVMSEQEFFNKVLLEENGKELLTLLEDGEVNICKRIGLMTLKDGQVEVPQWNSLISHLRIVNSV